VLGVIFYQQKGNIKERVCMKDLGIDGKMILKRILNSVGEGGCGRNLPGSE